MQWNSAMNSTLDIHDLFLIYSRFTAKDFCISRLTEYTPITIHRTVFFLSNHNSQYTKKVDHNHLIEGKYSPSYEKNEISQSRDTIYYIFPLLKENATY